MISALRAFRILTDEGYDPDHVADLIEAEVGMPNGIPGGLDDDAMLSVRDRLEHDQHDDPERNQT